MQSTSYVNGVPQDRSAAFDDAVTFGGAVAYSIDVQRVNLSTGATTTTASGVRCIGSPVVQVDGTAASRRTLTIELADEDGTLAPLVATDKLAPYGNELVVYTGFTIGGVDELVPLGVFRIQTSETRGDGRVMCSCLDRSSIIVANRFQVPYYIAAGTNTVTAISALLDDRYPGIDIVNESSTTTTVPLTVYQEGNQSGDPWANAAQLAASDGLEVFFNAFGSAVIRDVPDPTLILPCWQYEPDTADTLLIDSLHRLTAEGVYNVAVVTGEGSAVAAPVRATASIADVTNPMHPDWLGPRAVFFTSPLITDVTQAQDAADALLLRKAGAAEALSFTAAPHPAHEAGDVVRIVNDDLGIDVPVVLAKFGVPVLLDQQVTYDTYGRRTGAS